jgi:hypothetical protein
MPDFIDWHKLIFHVFEVDLKIITAAGIDAEKGYSASRPSSTDSVPEVRIFDLSPRTAPIVKYSYPQTRYHHGRRY